MEAELEDKGCRWPIGKASINPAVTGGHYSHWILAADPGWADFLNDSGRANPGLFVFILCKKEGPRDQGKGHGTGSDSKVESCA